MYDLAYLVDLGLILISQKHNELIAAKSKNAQLFILLGKILKEFTYLFKKSVTIIVTIAVIYVFEIIKVNEHNSAVLIAFNNALYTLIKT